MDMANIRFRAKSIHNSQALSSLASKEAIETVIGYTLRNGTTRKRKALDDDASIAVDKASRISKQILRELLPQEGWKVLLYLAKLKLVDPDFDFRVSYNSTSNAPTGVLWCTAGTKENFERFGDILFVDARKRHLNDLYWPYMAVSVLDGEEEVGVATEAIMSAESQDSQIFVLNAMFEMCSGVPKYSVKMVFGDGILNAHIMEKTGLTTCPWFTNQWHLLNQTWLSADGLRAHLFEALRADLESLVHSSSLAEAQEVAAKI